MKGGRDYQEDSLIASFPLGQKNGFAVLADGMGGQLAGGVASGLVISEAIGHLKMKETALDDATLDIPALLTDIAQAANQRISQHIAAAPDTFGMGSTLLATVMRGDQLYWVSVGDSPLLLYRDGGLTQLNKDHSMAPQIDMMVKVGAMSEEVGRNHPDRNTLTSAITGADIAQIDCPQDPTTLRAGDIIIAASDGLQFLDTNDILHILHKLAGKRSDDIANAFLSALDALADPDQDNATFAVIRISASSAAAQGAPCDQSDVLARLKGDLRRPTALQDQPPPEPAIAKCDRDQNPATGPGDPPGDMAPSDEPAKRTIRLVRSDTRSFEKVAPAPEKPPAHTDAEGAPLGWYRRHRLQTE